MRIKLQNMGKHCLSTNFLINEILYSRVYFSDKGCENSKWHNVNLLLCQLLY